MKSKSHSPTKVKNDGGREGGRTMSSGNWSGSPAHGTNHVGPGPVEGAGQATKGAGPGFPGKNVRMDNTENPVRKVPSGPKGVKTYREGDPA